MITGYKGISQDPKEKEETKHKEDKKQQCSCTLFSVSELEVYVLDVYGNGDQWVFTAKESFRVSLTNPLKVSYFRICFLFPPLS